MSDDREAAMDAAIAGVWQRMRPTILARFAAVEQALAAACRDGLEDALRDAAMHEAHKLAGSLGMFGFPEGSELTREVEKALINGLEAETAARYAERLRLLKLVLEG